MDHKANLTEAPVLTTLLKLTFPMIFGMLGLVIFNLVDTFFVGKLGTAELAALSFTTPVVLFAGSIAIGIGIGAASVISRAIGEQNQYKVQRLTTDSLTLALLVVIVFLLSGIITMNSVFAMLGADATVINLIKQYMLIWYLGMIFVVIPMVGNNAIRATGDTKTPSIIMITATVINILLDPLLIFGIGPFPKMGLAGAALATVIARSSTFVLALYILKKRKLITLKIPKTAELIDSWQQILYLGLPTAITRVIMPIGIGIITHILSYHGKEAVAAFGVSFKIEFFAMTVIMALASVFAPFIGQNAGANKINRINKGIICAQQISLVWGGFAFLILFLCSGIIAPLFNSNPKVISIIAQYLRIVPVGFGFQGILIVSGVALIALKKPLYSSGLMLLEMFAICIPLAFIGSKILGPSGVFAAIATAYILSGITAQKVLKTVLCKNFKSQETNNK